MPTLGNRFKCDLFTIWKIASPRLRHPLTLSPSHPSHPAPLQFPPRVLSSPQPDGACWKAPTGPAHLQDLDWQPASPQRNHVGKDAGGKQVKPAARDHCEVRQHHLNTVTQIKEVKNIQNSTWKVRNVRSEKKNKESAQERAVLVSRH